MHRFWPIVVSLVILLGCATAEPVAKETSVTVEVPVTVIVPADTLEPLPTYTPYPTYTLRPSETPTTTPTATAAPSLGTRGNPARVGDTVHLVTNEEVWDVTITQILFGEHAEPYADEEPGKGQEILAFYSHAMLLKGPKDEAVNIQIWDWELVDSKGRLQGMADLGGGGPYFGGRMFEGGDCEGWAFYFRDIGDPVSLVFRMSVDLENRGNVSGGAWFSIE